MKDETATVDLAGWFAPIVRRIVDHLAQHGYADLDIDDDALQEAAAVVSWDWWRDQQEPLEYEIDGRVEETVDRAEQRALELLNIVRRM